MIEFLDNKVVLIGPKGIITIPANDQITIRLGMLFEGECENISRTQCAQKFGITRQRYHQLLNKFLKEGAQGLKNIKRGPKKNYRRTEEVIRQIIRYRFLDPDLSPQVISQKMTQLGHTIATRSVERVISDYGLQKKTYI